MAEPLPVFTKRVYDRRRFGLNVEPKMIDEDSVTSFVSITAVAIRPEDAELISVSVDTANPIDVVTEGDEPGIYLQFRCTGGAAGAKYRCALRYVTTIEPQLESLCQVNVF